MGDATVFIPALQRAREAGLKTTLHVAEVPNVTESMALLEFHPDRVGHGTCLYPEQGGSDDLVSSLQSKKIPLGNCRILTRWMGAYKVNMRLLCRGLSHI